MADYSMTLLNILAKKEGAGPKPDPLPSAR